MAKNLKLLQILVGEEWGGAERFFEKLAIAFSEQGVTEKVALLRNPSRSAALRSAGVDVVEFDFGRGLRDLIARRRLQSLSDEFEPQLVLVWMNRAARRMPRGNFIKVGRLGGYYKIRNYKKCDYLIANTPDLVRHITGQGWPEDRVVMISNFGELVQQSPVPRCTFSTPENVPLMLAMGRLHPMKGFDVLIRSLQSLPGAWLWLAGEGPERGKLEVLAREVGVSDRVRFLGWRDDQGALLRSADVCVVPSRHEPLSNVIIESWSVRVPVVAAASEGPRWLITDEENGLLSAVDDVDSLSKQLGRVINDPALRNRIAENGEAHWRKNFSKEVIIHKYLEFFQNIIKK